MRMHCFVFLTRSILAPIPDHPCALEWTTRLEERSENVQTSTSEQEECSLEARGTSAEVAYQAYCCVPTVAGGMSHRLLVRRVSTKSEIKLTRQARRLLQPKKQLEQGEGVESVDGETEDPVDGRECNVNLALNTSLLLDSKLSSPCRTAQHKSTPSARERQRQ